MSEITEIMKQQVSGKLKWDSTRREREKEKKKDYNSTCNELLTNSKCINNKLLSGRRIECGSRGAQGSRRFSCLTIEVRAPGQH